MRLMLINEPLLLLLLFYACIPMIGIPDCSRGGCIAAPMTRAQLFMEAFFTYSPPISCHPATEEKRLLQAVSIVPTRRRPAKWWWCDEFRTWEFRISALGTFVNLEVQKHEQTLIIYQTLLLMFLFGIQEERSVHADDWRSVVSCWCFSKSLWNLDRNQNSVKNTFDLKSTSYSTFSHGHPNPLTKTPAT